MRFLTLISFICSIEFTIVNPAGLSTNAKNVKAGEIIIDCMPGPGSNEDGCNARGCAWVNQTTNNAPWCTLPEGYGYSIDGVESPTTLGFNLNLIIKDGQTSWYGNDIPNIGLIVEYWTQDIVRIKFDDPNNQRYEVPIDLDFKPSSKPTEVDYEVTYNNDPQFGVIVTRKSTGTVIFRTDITGFIFADQFLQITTNPPSSTIYGYGEQRHGQYLHNLNWKTWTAFARDNGPNNDGNSYGVHPFFLNIEDDGNANGVFLFNSNAQEVALQPAPAITFRTIGGILDFYIYVGPTPEDVVKQHASLIGYPTMPAYWFLGYHLSKYGYKSTDEVRQIGKSMRDNEIPYDVQICDIDAYDNSMDFSINPNGFSDMAAFVDELHQYGQRYMPIVDDAIGSASELIGNYPPLDDGLTEDVFIKQADGSILEGKVWPGKTYFPDFSHPNAVDYWTKQHQYFYSDLGVKFDAIWSDMNEPSDFVQGSIIGCHNNSYNHPPYPTHAIGATDGLYDKTICMDAQQTWGLHYNTHSLNGLSNARVTASALENVLPGKRPNILSRSTYAGSGKYTFHWLGDNYSTFPSLRDSIPGILEFNLFGIPMVGADICGFQANTYLELCIRWTQLGAFYPYCRNHNQGLVDQDPPSLGPEMIAAAKLVLNERYRLLPYLYTLLYEAHIAGGTVARPLAHEFPTDNNTYNVGFQFLWGAALLISPVVDKGATSVDIYFPQAKWYNYYTGQRVSQPGITVTVSAPLNGSIPLHVRGGYILPTQEPAVTTDLSRQQPFGLLVALDASGAASGSQFFDDGVTYETVSSGAFNRLGFTVSDRTLQIAAHADGAGPMGAPLDSIKFYGVPSAPAGVRVDGSILDASKYVYDTSTQVLTLIGLGLSLPADHTLTF